jgi:hypothetical protein
MARRNALLALAAFAGATIAVAPRLVDAQDADGFDAYVQSGTCAAPTELRINLKSERSHDVEPYEAKQPASDDTVVLGYYGAPRLPGFGFSVIYTDQPYSLVIADDTGAPRACGDILEPAADRFGEAGTAVVQLLPVEGGQLQGFAILQRTPLQRENDTVPTTVRIILADNAETVTGTPAEGYDGYVQLRQCAEPTEGVQIKLKSRGEHDIRPYPAKADDSAEPAVVAYYGAPLAPGFGLAAAHTDRDFALVISDTETGQPVACGDILEPDDDRFSDSGVALVQLAPSGTSTVQGFAIVERIGLQRELDVTPTRVRVLLSAPPVGNQ